ncbi:MAG TPA: biopolymer transporter ExbD, partial [Citreicella sp.]|nr:biopolymer transporter ExbD [Citreicella sp.]
GNAPADALVVHPDGRMSLKGQEISSVAEYMAGIGQEAPELVRLVPDRDASAAQLVTLGRELRAA